MKRLAVTLCLLAVTSLAIASDDASKDRGRALFTSIQLGTNGKSCNNCHPDGKGLANAAQFSADELGKIINRCINSPLKGKVLQPATIEMKSLILYIKSLAPTARH